MGRNGVGEIKSHPFFKGVDWRNLRNTRSPYKPPIKSATDTSNFDDFDEVEPWVAVNSSKGMKPTIYNKAKVRYFLTN